MNKQQGNTISLSEPMSPLSTSGTLNWLASLSDMHLIMIILWICQTLKNVSYLIIQCGDTRNHIGHSNKIDCSANGRICVCGKDILRGEEYFFQGEDFLTLFRIVDEWWTMITKSRLIFIQFYDCLKNVYRKHNFLFHVSRWCVPISLILEGPWCTHRAKLWGKVTRVFENSAVQGRHGLCTEADLWQDKYRNWAKP